MTEAQALAKKIKDIAGYKCDWAALDADVDRLAAMAQPPEGWVLVPVEPTKAMLKAAIYNTELDYAGAWTSTIGNWRAMLSAAPKPEDKL